MAQEHGNRPAEPAGNGEAPALPLSSKNGNTNFDKADRAGDMSTSSFASMGGSWPLYIFPIVLMSPNPASTDSAEQ